MKVEHNDITVEHINDNLEIVDCHICQGKGEFNGNGKVDIIGQVDRCPFCKGIGKIKILKGAER